MRCRPCLTPPDQVTGRPDPATPPGPYLFMQARPTAPRGSLNEPTHNKFTPCLQYHCYIYIYAPHTPSAHPSPDIQAPLCKLHHRLSQPSRSVYCLCTIHATLTKQHVHATRALCAFHYFVCCFCCACHAAKRSCIACNKPKEQLHQRTHSLETHRTRFSPMQHPCSERIRDPQEHDCQALVLPHFPTWSLAAVAASLAAASSSFFFLHMRMR